MSKFDDKCRAINGLLNNTCKFYVFVTEGDDNNELCVQAKAPSPVLLHMVNRLCNSIREKLTEQYNAKVADELLKTVLKTDEEIDEDYEKVMADKSIPDWLKKLMKVDDDDSTDEADDEEKDEEEDDVCGDNPDLSVRVDLHVHNDDDGEE